VLKRAFFVAAQHSPTFLSRVERVDATAGLNEYHCSADAKVLRRPFEGTNTRLADSHGHVHGTDATSSPQTQHMSLGDDAKTIAAAAAAKAKKRRRQQRRATTGMMPARRLNPVAAAFTIDVDDETDDDVGGAVEIKTPRASRDAVANESTELPLRLSPPTLTRPPATLFGGGGVDCD
jgi:hypothetical protein